MDTRVLLVLTAFGTTLSMTSWAHAQSPPASTSMPAHSGHAQPPPAGGSMAAHGGHTMDPLDMMQGPLGISWMREGSGTAWQPDATPMFSHMQRLGSWSLMEHYNVFAGVDAAAGPRGATQVFSTNWLMVMARRSLLGGQFGARVMLSLEPLTLIDGGYPLLLQTGETWQGRPLRDRQHPHDLFMEVAVQYQREIAGGVAFQVYVAPSGEPALGPVAFPHRLAAFYDPLGPISHHWLDSTHISFGVVTAGVYTRHVKVEGSWFNGREPDETRWNFDLRVPDSWSARVTVNPVEWLSAQVSYGYLRSPEALRPDESQQRVTASATSTVRFGASHWATTAAWGVDLAEGHDASNALLLESSLNLLGHYLLYGRAEYVAKSAEDLVLSGAQQERLFGVGNVSLGAAYAFSPVLDVVPAVGVRGSLAIVGDDLRGAYGDNVQLGGVAYVQIRPAEMRMGSMATRAMPAMTR